MNIEDILKQPDGSVEALNVNLDIIPLKDKYQILGQLLNKISRTGSITVIGLDIFTFAKFVTAGTRSLVECNDILAQNRSMDTLDNVKRFLLENNYKTETCKRDNGYYICTARYQV